MRIVSIAVLAASVLLLSANATYAQSGDQGPVLQRGASWVSRPIVPEFIQMSLADRPAPRGWKPGDEVREVPRRHYGAAHVPGAISESIDPLALAQAAYSGGRAPTAFGAVVANLNGLSTAGLTPGDPVIDIGTTHAIQAINSSGGTSYAIHDKTGLLVAGPFTLDGLGTGNCANGYGDPIVFFDELARRWLLTEFTNGTNDLCIYVSQYEDPTLPQTWARYAFVPPNFPDYPKYGVWHDAYYLGTNESPGGLAMYALNRKAMLEGRTMTTQRFTGTKLSGFGFQVAQPIDIDGQFAPDAATPGLFIRHNDAEAHGRGSVAPDWVELFSLAIDWTTPANSVLSGPVQIPVTEFSSDLNGLSAFNAFPQPNGTKLDPLREQVMYRAAYRRFPTHEAIVGNFVTDIDGNDTGGVRWFELRRSGGTWSLYQEGTVALGDFVDRWMGASAMDEAGNIALSYSVTRDASHPAPNNTGVFPGLRYIGRLAADVLGIMTTGEQTLVAGAASQSGSTRWGDYHAMGVDPADGCTFWTTGQHLPTASWATRIGAFRHNECNTPRFGLEASPITLSMCAGGPTTSSTLTLPALTGFSGNVALVTSGLPAGVSATLTPATVAVPGSSTLQLAAGGGAAIGNTLFNVEASNGGVNKRLQLVASVQSALAAGPTLASPANAATGVALRPTLSWNTLAGATSYLLEVAADAGFSSIVYSTTTGSTSQQVGVDLAGSTLYYWRVTGINGCGTGVASVSRSFTTMVDQSACPLGTNANSAFFDNTESGVGSWTRPAGTGTNTWDISTARAYSPTHAWLGVDPSATSDQRLVSPSIAVPTGENPVKLIFWHAHDMEERNATTCWDGGILEVSNNGGASFTQVTSFLEGAYYGTISAASGSSNPLKNLSAWCGTATSFSRIIVDLTAYAGQNIQLRYRLGSDASVGREGWYVDDVKVQSCQPVPPAATSTTLVSSNDPSAFGQTTTLTATVSSGAGTPTGNVEFRDGATPIATVALSGGVATYATAAFSVGVHNLSAVYAGATGYAGSSGLDTHTVVKADTTLSISDSPEPSTQGSPVTITASLSVVAPGAGAPGGSITVTATNSTGCTITLPAVSCALTFSASGSQTINASYGGDGNFNGSTAASITNLSNPSNTAPTITVVSDQTIAEDGSTGALAFTIGDVQDAATALVVTATSSNATLVPNAPANLVLAGSGAPRSINVIPAANQSGSSTITLRVTDTGALFTETTFLVTVTAVDDPPVAVADSPTVTEDSGASTIDVLANDTDIDGGTKLVTLVGTATNGTTAIGGGGANVSYTPTGNYCGADSFSYTITGGSSATVSVTVTCVDDAPVALADSPTVTEDSGANTIDVLANDTDIDGGTKLVTLVGTASNGTTAVGGGGANVSYTPTGNYCGADTFSYEITGGSSATVSVTVTCVNDAPTAVGSIPSQTAIESLPFAIATAAAFSDVDGDTLAYALGAGAPAWAAINAVSGEITGTPPPGSAPGPYPLTVIVNDPSSATAVQSFDLAVLPNQLFGDGFEN